MKTILFLLLSLAAFGQQKVSSARMIVATDSAARSMDDSTSVMPPKRVNERIMPLYSRYGALRKTLDSLKSITPQKGDKGDQGPIGPQGPQGAPGRDGLNGTNGVNGKDGSVGATGAQGPPGTPGVNGTNGTNGKDGATGATGPQGPVGPTGLQGPTGPTGPAGPTGATGAQGIPGTSAPTSLTAQATVNLGILAIGGVTSFTVSVPGAQIGMTPIVSVEAGSIPGLTFTAGVQSPGIGKVGVVASIAILAGNKTYYITIPR